MADGMLRWCQRTAGGYPGVGNNIKNFKTDFRSGLIWCAILSSFDKTCLDFASLKTETEGDLMRNHRLAFEVAERRFQVDPLLDAEDMVELAIPDHRSVLTYVSQMHKHMKDLPFENPYYRDFEEGEFDAQRKKMEEARAEKERLQRSPAPQPIVKGKSLNASASEIAPSGPCGKCQRDHNYPQCKEYEASEIRKGRCLGCGHSPGEHAGYVPESEADKPAAREAAAPVDEAREDRRRKAREEQAELDRIDAHRMGQQIEDAANSLTDFFSPAPVKVSSLNAGANDKIPDGPCGQCQRENNYPQCMHFEVSKTRKGKCMTCMHSTAEHAGYVASKAESGGAAKAACPACSEPLSGSCAVFGGKEMHKKCFVCAGGCGKELAGKKNVVAVQGKAYCDVCSLKAFAAAQPKQPPANTEDRERKQRAAARRERRKELIQQGVALGIVPGPRPNEEKRLEALRAQMKRRKATRKAPEPEGKRSVVQPPATAAAAAADDDGRRQREEKEADRKREKEREEERERKQRDEADDKEREERRKQRERERDEEAKQEQEREERRKEREREKEAEAQKERDGEERARKAKEEEEAVARERERKERDKPRESSSRASAAEPAAGGDADTTVDLAETDPEKLLAALVSKERGGGTLSAAEGRAKRRATTAVERKKEEEAFEREMEERRKAREERRRAREAAE